MLLNILRLATPLINTFFPTQIEQRGIEQYPHVSFFLSPLNSFCSFSISHWNFSNNLPLGFHSPVFPHPKTHNYTNTHKQTDTSSRPHTQPRHWPAFQTPLCGFPQCGLTMFLNSKSNSVSNLL